MSTPPDLKVTAKHARADGIIAKPFDVEELVRIELGG
jgi:hypothetical protein